MPRMRAEGDGTDLLHGVLPFSLPAQQRDEGTTKQTLK